MSKHHAPRAAQRKKKGKPVQEEPPLLSATGSGYVKDPKYALGMTSQHPTPPENLLADQGEVVVHEPEPAAVYPDDQRWITQQAQDNGAILYAAEQRDRRFQSVQAKVRELCTLAKKQGADLPELEKIDRELESARRRLVREAA